MNLNAVISILFLVLLGLVLFHVVSFIEWPNLCIAYIASLWVSSTLIKQG